MKIKTVHDFTIEIYFLFLYNIGNKQSKERKKMRKKQKNLAVFSAVFAVLGITAMPLNAAASASADFEPFQRTNLSLDLAVTYTDYSGNALTPKRIVESGEIPDNVLTVNMSEEDIAWVAFHNSIFVCKADGTATLGWATVDLGESALIDKLNVQFWNDHSYTDIIVQTSADSAFTQNVQTVFNSDADGSVGQGVGQAYTYTDKREVLQTLDLVDSYNRYVRVTARDLADNTTKFSRLEIIGAKASEKVDSTADVLPVVASHNGGNYATDISVTLTNANGKGEIYYTTDGSVPTSAAQRYTETISVTENTLLRAVVCVDGIFSEIRDFTYLIQDVAGGANVAAGKPAKFYNESFTAEVECKGFNGASASNMHLTDGSFNPSGSCVTSNASLGWAVIDFGKAYWIDGVGVSFWHDWTMNGIVQLSMTPDFANPITVFEGKHVNATYKSVVYTLDVPVEARYIRAYNDAGGRGYSVYTELEAYAYVEPFEVKAQEYLVSASGFEKTREFVCGVTETQVKSYLPSQITYTDSDGNTAAVNGNWMGDFTENEVGRYAFTFIPDTKIPTDIYEVLTVDVQILAAGDKTVLTESILAAKAIDRGLYTKDSTDALEAAVSIAEEKAGQLLTQEGVDEALENLQKAVNALDPLGDVTQLRALYDEYAQIRTQNDYKESIYTQNSFDGMKVQLQAVYEAVIKNGNINYNANGVEILLTNLQKAQKNLRERGDTTQLAEVYQNLSNLSINAYTVSSWAVCQRALANAKTVLDADAANVTAAEVQGALSKLTEAAPVLRADMTELNARYNELYAFYGADEEDTQGMLKSTWFEYVNAMYYVRVLLADSSDVAQEQANGALDRLNAAVNGLTAHGDKTQLHGLVETCTYARQEYTQTTYTAYAAALKTAQTLLAKPNSEVSIEMLSSAITALETAVDGLIRLADKTTLNAAVEKANRTILKEYTATTANALLEKLSEAKLLQEKETATQAEVDGAAANLETAYAGLVAIGNKTALLNCIESYETLTEQEKDTENYKYFLEVLAYAKAVRESNEVSQADVDEAVRILTQAAATRNEEPKEGCGSVINVSTLGLVLVGAWAVNMIEKTKKRKED